MPTDGAKVWAGYRQLDAILAAEPGGHATSPAWLAFLERWLLSGKVRAVVRKGRQGGGSEVLGHRLPVAVALFGDYQVPPGQRIRIVFASQRQLEAAEKLYGVEHVLDALHVKHVRSGDVVELVDRPLAFQSFPCSEAAVRGPSAIYALEDELAIWRNSDGANPANRVDAAILPSGVTQENFRIASCSSPQGQEDYHAELYSRGETANQVVAEGPSWHWSPAITEERTHELQPDPIAWKREFAAIPQGSEIAAFDGEALEFAFQPLGFDQVISNSVIGLDPAGRGRDRFGICAACWAMPTRDPDEGFEIEQALHPDGRPSGGVIIHRERPRLKVPPPAPRLHLWHFRSVDSRFRAENGLTGVVDKIVTLAREVDARLAATDQTEAFSLASLLPPHGIKVDVGTMGGGMGHKIVSRLRTLLNTRSVYIEASPEVQAQFRSFRERTNADGIHYNQLGRAPDGSHWDDVSSALQIIRADLAGLVSGSPSARGSGGIQRLDRRTGEWVQV